MEPTSLTRFATWMSEESAITHLIFNAYWEPLEFELPGSAMD